MPLNENNHNPNWTIFTYTTLVTIVCGILFFVLSSTNSSVEKKIFLTCLQGAALVVIIFLIETKNEGTFLRVLCIMFSIVVSGYCIISTLNDGISKDGTPPIGQTAPKDSLKNDSTAAKEKHREPLTSSDQKEIPVFAAPTENAKTPPPLKFTTIETAEYTYTGEVNQNNEPCSDNATLTYKTAMKIDEVVGENNMAEPGDKLVGSWVNGRIKLVSWYRGDLFMGSITIGSEDKCY